MTTLLTARSLLTDTGLVDDPIVRIEDGTIVSVTTRAEEALPNGAAHHDFPDAVLTPAFFDVHTHGCRGCDVMEGSAATLSVVNGFLAAHGVGAYLPTTISAPRDVTLRSLAALAKTLAAPAQPGHARPVGIHFEGPFLSHAKRGTHPPQDLLAPSIAFFDAMWQAAEGRATLMTIAPELPGAIELIAHAVARGLRISIGHTDGLAADASAAIAAGAVSATHTFNAMRRLDHREPGVLGAVLTTDTLYAELICDGLHVDPSMVQLFSRAKPEARAILITDAMSATGMPDGSYKLGELDVEVKQGRATTGIDTLAGSTITLDTAVRNYTRFAGLPLTRALHAATRNPARMTGLDAAIGSLAAGRRADINVLSPEGVVAATYLGGVRVSATA